MVAALSASELGNVMGREPHRAGRDERVLPCAPYEPGRAAAPRSRPSPLDGTGSQVPGQCGRVAFQGLAGTQVRAPVEPHVTNRSWWAELGSHTDRRNGSEQRPRSRTRPAQALSAAA